jgi:hypothetical protein
VSLDQSNVIDALGIDETGAAGRVLLVIRHDAPWDGSDRQLYLLQEKLNAYLSFALDGEMAAEYPDFARRPLGLRIDCATPPDPRTLHLLGHVRRQLQFQEIGLEVRVSRDAAASAPSAGPSHHCGGGCQCQ